MSDTKLKFEPMTYDMRRDSTLPYLNMSEKAGHVYFRDTPNVLIDATDALKNITSGDKFGNVTINGKTYVLPHHSAITKPTDELKSERDSWKEAKGVTDSPPAVAGPAPVAPAEAPAATQKPEPVAATAETPPPATAVETPAAPATAEPLKVSSAQQRLDDFVALQKGLQGLKPGQEPEFKEGSGVKERLDALKADVHNSEQYPAQAALREFNDTVRRQFDQRDATPGSTRYPNDRPDLAEQVGELSKSAGKEFEDKGAMPRHDEHNFASQALLQKNKEAAAEARTTAGTEPATPAPGASGPQPAGLPEGRVVENTPDGVGNPYKGKLAADGTYHEHGLSTPTAPTDKTPVAEKKTGHVAPGGEGADVAAGAAARVEAALQNRTGTETPPTTPGALAATEPPASAVRTEPRGFNDQGVTGSGNDHLKFAQTTPANSGVSTRTDTAPFNGGTGTNPAFNYQGGTPSLRFGGGEHTTFQSASVSPGNGNPADLPENVRLAAANIAQGVPGTYREDGRPLGANDSIPPAGGVGAERGGPSLHA